MLARNPNVHPLSETARSLWPRHSHDMLVGWEAGGYDATLGEGDVVRVTHGVRFEDRAESWTEISVRVSSFALGPGSVERAAQYLSISSAKVRELVARGFELGRTLSRNRRLRCADVLDLCGAVEWDAIGLANNASLVPRELLLLCARFETAAFHAELSAHPRLRMQDVLEFRDRPWCWYTLSRSTSVTTLETYGAHKHALPFELAGILANPLFDDYGEEPVRPVRPVRPVCVQHGFACSYCTTLAAARGERGFGFDAPLVNWEIYMRLSEIPDDAVRVARQAGVFDSESASNAHCALLGNPAVSLAHVAWCLESLRAAGRLTTWVRVTAATNELRAAREAYEDALERATLERARLAPAVAQLLLRRGMPRHFLPFFLPYADGADLLSWRVP
jgi:hypothetical protein